MFGHIVLTDFFRFFFLQIMIFQECEAVAKQGDRESRRLWRHVTVALRKNNIQTATSAKKWIEQRQRDEAKKRQVSSDSGCFGFLQGLGLRVTFREIFLQWLLSDLKIYLF